MIRSSPHSIATCSPRPSLTWRSTKLVAALKIGGSRVRGRQAHSRVPSGAGGSGVSVLAGRSNSAIAAGSTGGANVAASTHATRYEASQIRRPVPRSWTSNTKPIRRSLMSAYADANRDVVAQPGRRSEPRLDRRARQVDAELPQHRRPIAPQAAEQILFGVLRVPEEDAEPQDARRVGIRPHDARVQVVEERHDGNRD